MKIPGCQPQAKHRWITGCGNRPRPGPASAWTRLANPKITLGLGLRPAWVQHRRDRLHANIEALLFASEDPLSVEKIQGILGEEPAAIRQKLGDLELMLSLDESAFRLQEVAGGWRLVTDWKLDRWLTNLSGLPGPSRLNLTESLRDTLAIVAHRQPATRAQVEAIRGVPCGDSLKQLLDLGLIRMAGREATLGRPVIYRTSRRFLLWCGLRSLDELPPLASSQSTPTPKETKPGSGQAPSS